MLIILPIQQEAIGTLEYTPGIPSSPQLIPQAASPTFTVQYLTVKSCITNMYCTVCMYMKKYGKNLKMYLCKKKKIVRTGL